MPMDIDFIVQDAYALVRPDWKLVTDIQEASRLFAEACAVNYQGQMQSQSAGGEMIEDDAELSSDEELGDDNVPDELEAMASSGDEVEVSQSQLAMKSSLTQPRKMQKK